jgi:hypothetical protein
VHHTLETLFSAHIGPDSSKEGFDASKIDPKPLPPTLYYEYLDLGEIYPVIINATLNQNQTYRVLVELKITLRGIGVHDRGSEGYQSLHMHAPYTYGGQLQTEDQSSKKVEP